MRIHRAVVTRTRDLAPSLVRVTLAGCEGFATTGIGDEYVRTFFPSGPDRRDVPLPVPSGEGWEWPEGVEAGPVRTLTVRAVRPDLGEVDIDIVRHAGGVAGPWATHASAGDVLGVGSPSGLWSPGPQVCRQMLVTDLAGVPAAARLAGCAPAGMSTRVLAEVPTHRDAAALAAEFPDDVEVDWTIGGNGRSRSRLAALVRTLPGPGPEDYVWVAGETRELREVRRHLRHELGLPPTAYKVLGYWTAGPGTWQQRFDALPEDTREELLALWRDETRDVEEIEDEYVERLERLGL